MAAGWARAVSRRPHLWAGLAVLAAALALGAAQPWFLAGARLAVFDAFQRAKPRPFDPLSPVRIVDIDEASLAKLGQWPWPRTRLADLVDRLAGLGASAIVFDVVFAEPDRTSPANLARTWPNAPEDLRRRLAQLPDHDALFAAAIARAPVVTGFVLASEGGRRAPASKGGFAVAGDDARPFVPSFPAAVPTLAALEDAARGNGSITSLPDRDGVIRRMPLVLRFGDTLYPSLAAEALRVAQGAKTGIIKASGAHGVESFGEKTGIALVKIGDFVIPTDAQGRVWINYSGTRRARFIPAWRVFEPDFDPAEVAGRIVFVGTSAAGLKDLRATPLSPVAAGVELYPELLEQVFANAHLKRPDLALGLEAVYVLVFGLAVVFLLPVAGARWSGLLGLGAVALAFGVSWHAFSAWGWLLDPVFPAVTIAAVYLVETAIILLRTESERRWVRGAFARYLSPALVERLAEQPTRLALGGEMREMTILFSDIRGFTARAERLDAHGLTRFMNRYLTPMSGIVLGHQGTIDKYLGDAIMAFWNAPLDDADHARNACRAALAMRAELARLNGIWAEEAPGFEPVRVGIGINTGVCCVGNMGSDQRFDYSVLGDDVNLASRLEGLSKLYGVDIVASERACASAPELAALELDLVRVKGRARPVRVFTLLGGEVRAADPQAADPQAAGPHQFGALLAAQGRFLAAYRLAKWDEAEAALAEARALAPAPLAPLYALYGRRVEECRASPPAADWDGIFVAAEK